MVSLSKILAYVLFIQSFAFCAPLQEPGGSGLNIVIIEGEGAINNIRQRTAREPIVQVEDRNRRPVAGAVVVFTLPGDGASGTFPNGARTLTVLTDQNGRAAARGLRPNTVAGQVLIRVNASFQGRTGSASIAQTNVAAAAAGAAATGISAKLIAILAGIGGAALVGGIVAATRGGGGNNVPVTPGAPPPTTVNPGGGTVGAPR